MPIFASFHTAELSTKVYYLVDTNKISTKSVHISITSKLYHLMLRGGWGWGQGWELDPLLLPTLLARLLVCIHYTVPKNDPKDEVCVTREQKPYSNDWAC